MIKKGLKVGDTFEDGNRKFVVKEVVPEGYISEQIKEEPKATEEKPKKTTTRKK